MMGSKVISSCNLFWGGGGIEGGLLEGEKKKEKKKSTPAAFQNSEINKTCSHQSSVIQFKPVSRSFLALTARYYSPQPQTKAIRTLAASHPFPLPPQLFS